MAAAGLLAGVAYAAEPSWEQRQSMPDWANAVLERPPFTADYVLSVRLNPFLVQGDFNGDGRIDLAVLVERRSTGADGIAVVHAGAAEPIVLGAGNAFGTGGRDFSWMNAWHVHSKGPVPQGAGSGSSPTLVGDALVVEKLEAASGIVYWDGSAYRWYQQGD